MTMTVKDYVFSDVFKRIENPEYNINKIEITPESEIEVYVGTPLTATGIATDAASIVGLSTENVNLSAGSPGMVGIVDRFFGVILDKTHLEERVTGFTAAMTAELEKRGAKLYEENKLVYTEEL